jgi:hypothetical protein
MRTDYGDIHFELITPSLEGHPLWEVTNKKNKTWLGNIVWWHLWEAYVFKTTNELIYAAGHLHDIGYFLQDVNKEANEQKPITSHPW